MRIGPFESVYFAKVKELLDRSGRDYEIYVDEDVKLNPQLAMRTHGRVYQGTNAFMYFDFSDETYSLLRSQLEELRIGPYGESVEPYVSTSVDEDNELEFLADSNKISESKYSGTGHSDRPNQALKPIIAWLFLITIVGIIVYLFYQL